MDWDDLGLAGGYIFDGSDSSFTRTPRETPNAVLCGWLGALAGGALGVVVLGLLFPPVPSAGAFDFSLFALANGSPWGLLLATFGGMLLGAAVGKAVARRYFD